MRVVIQNDFGGCVSSKPMTCWQDVLDSQAWFTLALSEGAYQATEAGQHFARFRAARQLAETNLQRLAKNEDPIVGPGP